jgi:hypothetical protein
LVQVFFFMLKIQKSVNLTPRRWIDAFLLWIT